MVAMECGLYIHIPFCRQKCPYCDFYSILYEPGLAAMYIDILSNQIKKINTKISTVYIGGGTPSVLDTELLDRLLKNLRSVFKSSKENTVEANPESLDETKIELLLRRGINRLSIGIQSIKENKLKILGRLHTVSQAYGAIFKAKRKGFKNISIDVIYGVPGETLKDWKKELKEVICLPIKHISCYALSCEKNTPFYKYKKVISEEVVAEMMRWNIRYLPQKKFFQYEISNFAKNGFRCRHNLLYWNNCSYIGLGPSTVSYINNIRSKNISCLHAYIRSKEQGKDPIEYKEELSPFKRAKETASLNIRMLEGIDFLDFKKRTGFDFWEVEDKKTIKLLIRNRLIRYKRGNKSLIGIQLTPKGVLFADEVCSWLV